MTRRAYMWGLNESLPPRYPWEIAPQRITEIKVHGDEAGTVSLVTTGGTYRIPYDTIVKMPMRDDGSTQDWATEVPRTDQICIGDRVTGQSRKWVVTDMYKLPGAAITNVGVQLLDQVTGETMHCVGYAGQPFYPGAMRIRRSNRGESRTARTDKPMRGPYKLVANDDIVYYFYVHPTGRGRWSNDIPPFVIENQAGEYFTRPIPKYGKGSHNMWSMVSFHGKDDTERHPNDPQYRP